MVNKVLTGLLLLLLAAAAMAQSGVNGSGNQLVLPGPAPEQPRFDPKLLTLVPYFGDRLTYDRYREAYPELKLPEQKPFDYAINEKRWIDPAACASNLQRINYERAFVVDVKGIVQNDKSGKPLVDRMSILRREACSVNIPPNAAYPDGAEAVYAIPLPMRELSKSEEFEYGFGNVLYVRRLDLWPHSQDVVDYTAEDRAMLRELLSLLQEFLKK